MKRSLFYLTLVLVAVLTGGLSLFTEFFPDWFTSATAFPFEQIGMALRALSASGSIGNGFAVALWLLISLIPVALIFFSPKRKGKALENLLLVLLSATLAICLYHMVNPALVFPILAANGEDFIPTVKGVLGSVVWSVLIGFFVLRILRLFRDADTRLLMKYAQVLLYLLCYVFVAVFFLFHPYEFITKIGSVTSIADGIQVSLRFIVATISMIMSVLVCVRALDLTDSFLARDRERITISAYRLSDVCVRALKLITISSVAFYVIVLLMIGKLSDVHVMIEIPIVSIAFVVAVLLLACLINENRKLSEDNELFI